MPSAPASFLNRLSGFVMIVNTLAPVALLALVVGFGGFVLPDTLREVRDAARDIRETAIKASAAAGAIAENIEKRAEAAKKELARIGSAIKAAEKGVEKALDKVPTKAIRDAVGKAIDVVLKPLDPVIDLGEELKKLGAEVTKLKVLKTYFDQVAKDAKRIYDNLDRLFGVLAAWAGFLWTFMVVLGAWIGLSIALWAWRRLAVGFALMRGEPVAAGAH